MEKESRKNNAQLYFQTKFDAKINSQPESLASKVDEQLTEVI